MTCPEGGSVEVETLLDGGHGANRSKVNFRSVAATSILSLLPTSVSERTSGSDKLNQSRCNSQSTAKKLIARRTYDRTLIGFITYDKILVIETVVTLLLYLNLFAYRVQCLSATRYSYLIKLLRYNNRS